MPRRKVAIMAGTDDNGTTGGEASVEKTPPADECRVSKDFAHAMLKKLVQQFIHAGGNKLWVTPRKHLHVESCVLWPMLAAPHEHIKRLVLANAKLYGGVTEESDGYLKFHNKETFWNALGVFLHTNTYKNVHYWQVHESAMQRTTGAPNQMYMADDKDGSVPLNQSMEDEDKTLFKIYHKQLREFDFLEYIMGMLTSVSTASLPQKKKEKNDAITKEIGTKYSHRKTSHVSSTNYQTQLYLQVPQPRCCENKSEAISLKPRLSNDFIKELLIIIRGRPSTPNEAAVADVKSTGIELINLISHCIGETSKRNDVLNAVETNTIQMMLRLSTRKMDKLRRIFRWKLHYRLLASRQSCEDAVSTHYSPEVHNCDFKPDTKPLSNSQRDVEHVLAVRVHMNAAISSIIDSICDANLPILASDKRLDFCLQLDFGGTTTKVFLLLSSPGLERQGYSTPLGTYEGTDSYENMAPYLKALEQEVVNLQNTMFLFIQQNMQWDWVSISAQYGNGDGTRTLPSRLELQVILDKVTLYDKQNNISVHTFKRLKPKLQFTAVDYIRCNIFLSSDLKGQMAASGRPNYSPHGCLYCPATRATFLTTLPELTIEQLRSSNPPVCVPCTPLFPSIPLHQRVTNLHLMLGAGSKLYDTIQKFVRTHLDADDKALQNLLAMDELRAAESLAYAEYSVAFTELGTLQTVAADFLKAIDTRAQHVAALSTKEKTFRDNAQSILTLEAQMGKIGNLVSKKYTTLKARIIFAKKSQHNLKASIIENQKNLNKISMPIQFPAELTKVRGSISTSGTTGSSSISSSNNNNNNSSSSSSSSNNHSNNNNNNNNSTSSSSSSSNSSSSSSSSSSDAELITLILQNARQKCGVASAKVTTARNDIKLHDKANQAYMATCETGPVMAMFLNCMKSSGVFTQQYFGDAHLNGAQVRNLLKRWPAIHEKVSSGLTVLHCNDDAKLAWSTFSGNITPVAKLLQSIFEKTQSVCIMPAQTILDLRDECQKLQKLWVELGITVTPKMHVIFFHLADLVERHGVHGIFNESFIERMHYVMNYIARDVCNTGNFHSNQRALFRRLARSSEPNTLNAVMQVESWRKRKAAAQTSFPVKRQRATTRPLRNA